MKTVLSSLAAVVMMISPTLADVTVSGRGTAAAAPDTAFVNVGVVTTHVTARSALLVNNRKMATLFETLETGFDIPKHCLQTSQFSVAPKYIYKSGEKPMLVGYTVSNSLSIKLEKSKLDLLGQILDAVVTDGANRINGIQFSISDRTELLKSARIAAVKDALAKAELLTSTAGVELGRLKSISESSSFQVQSKTYLARSFADERPGNVPIAAGQQKITVNVHAVFTIAE